MVELKEDSIITLLGYWEDNHTFVCEGGPYEIWNNHMIKPELGVYYWINVKYIPKLKVWTAFQIVPVPEDYKM